MKKTYETITSRRWYEKEPMWNPLSNRTFMIIGKKYALKRINYKLDMGKDNWEFTNLSQRKSWMKNMKATRLKNLTVYNKENVLILSSTVELRIQWSNRNKSCKGNSCHHRFIYLCALQVNNEGKINTFFRNMH